MLRKIKSRWTHKKTGNLIMPADAFKAAGTVKNRERVRAYIAQCSDVPSRLDESLSLEGTLSTTLLIEAATHGHDDIVADLLDAGADIHALSSKGRGPALNAAAGSNQLKTMQLLISRGANINFQNKAGKDTALHRAAYKNFEKAALLLLQNGADPSLINSRRRTAAEEALAQYNAALSKKLAAVKILGADKAFKCENWHLDALCCEGIRNLVYVSDRRRLPDISAEDFLNMDNNSINLLLHSYYHSIAAFFTEHHEEIKNNPGSAALNSIVSAIRPAFIGRHLKNILNRMGGYCLTQQHDLETTIGFEIEYSNIPYQFRSLVEETMNVIQDKWGHPGDYSVKRTNYICYGGESTSPVLHNLDEMRAAFVNVAFLQAMGGKADDSCGLHVHVGVKTLPIPEKFRDIEKEKYYLEFIRQFLVIYKREESEFRSAERKYSLYTRETRLKNIKYDDIKHIDDLSELTDIIQCNRYCEINLLAYDKHGTIEVRRFAGTTEEPHIFRIISMIYAMAAEAKARTEEFFEHSAHPATKKISAAGNYPPPAFFLSHRTQRHRDLFMLAVNPSQENMLGEVLLDEKESEAVCTITDNEGCSIKSDVSHTGPDILEKLKSHTPLADHEKNEILLEFARQGTAKVSRRVGKTVEILEEHHARSLRMYQ